MLLFGVAIPATVPQRSKIPEGLMNYPVYMPAVTGVMSGSFSFNVSEPELSVLMPYLT